MKSKLPFARKAILLSRQREGLFSRGAAGAMKDPHPDPLPEAGEGEGFPSPGTGEGGEAQPSRVRAARAAEKTLTPTLSRRRERGRIFPLLERERVASAKREPGEGGGVKTLTPTLSRRRERGRTPAGARGCAYPKRQRGVAKMRRTSGVKDSKGSVS